MDYSLPGIGNWLTVRERLTPDKEAVVDGDVRLTYAELNHRVNQLTSDLIALGLEPGDRLGMLSYNRHQFVEVIMAAAKLGAVLVPFNWRLTGPELAFQADDSKTKTLIYDPELGELADDLKSKSGIEAAIVLGEEDRGADRAYEPLLASGSEAEPTVNPAPTLESPHIIMYTAGTTGSPKGAILSQGASFWNALNLQPSMDFTSEDRDLLVLPMFHIGGIGLFTLPMLYQGGTVIIQKVFDPAETIRLLKDEDITLFFGVPAVFLFLIQSPDFDSSVFENVRSVMSGGAPLPVSLVEEYDRAGIALQQGFGMSEAAPSIATLPKEMALDKAGSIGQPVFHLDVKIVDDRMNELPTNQVGELIMRGPNIMEGYWNREEANREAFSGGWFHSGDLARMDEEGCLWIVDRKKDMFISGGENVYPAEVENAIFELESVSEVAVIGVPDERWGESCRAVVALKEGMSLDAEEVIDHCRSKLAKYKIPKSVVFVEALPRNAAGKVLKKDLRQQALND